MSGCDWLFAGWAHHSAGQPTKPLAAYVILSVSFCSCPYAGILCRGSSSCLCTLILCRGSLASLCVFVMLRGRSFRVSLHCEVTSECVLRQIFGQYNITVTQTPAAILQWCVAAALYRSLAKCRITYWLSWWWARAHTNRICQSRSTHPEGEALWSAERETL